MINKIHLRKAEKYLFLLITILNLLPVLQGRFFPTMDGPAHLYNAKLITELLFNNNSQLGLFFTFNQFPVPNWIGHFILSFTNLFFPAYIGEKILLLLYFTALPYSFRALIKTLNPANIEYSYFIFPFCYSLLLALGFYNFSLAIVLMLLTLRYWIKKDTLKITLKSVLILALLLGVTYFSHIFVFILLLFFISLHILYNGMYNTFSDRAALKAVLLTTAKKFLSLLFASFIPLLLSFIYLHSGSTDGISSFAGKQELVDWLKTVRPIIAYIPEIEEAYTKKIFYLFAALIIILIYERINALIFSFNSAGKHTIFSICRTIPARSDFWLISAIILLVLYFLLPDKNDSAGFISIRIGFLFFIFLIIGFSMQSFPKWLGYLSVSILLYLNFSLNTFYNSVIKDLNKIAIHHESAAKHIEANSVVLPVNYSDNWLSGHFSNYAGIDKPMIILENYECLVGYFPLKWNYRSIPNTIAGITEIDDLPCLPWVRNKDNPHKSIDYIFVSGDFPSKPDSCHQLIMDIIVKDYTLTYSNEYCRLFRLKQ